VVQLSQTHLSEVIAHALMCCSIKKFSSQDFYSLPPLVVAVCHQQLVFCFVLFLFLDAINNKEKER